MIEGEISRLRSATKRMCATGTPSIALLCMSISVFSPFFFLLYPMPFGLRWRRQHTYIQKNAPAAQCLERIKSLSSSGRAKLFFFFSVFSFLHWSTRPTLTCKCEGQLNKHTYTHTHTHIRIGYSESIETEAK